MASKKKESEGIALLSIYGDEDEDMEEDIDNDNDNSDNHTVLTKNKEQIEVGANEAANMEEDDSEGPNNSNNTNTAPVSIDNSTPPPGMVQQSTQSTAPQSSENVGQSQSDALNYKGNESESVETEEAVNIIEDGQKEVDPLDKFLPPPPMTKCSDDLQEKIIKFFLLKEKTGRSFNSEVRKRKEYLNPDFLIHVVTYQDIDQIGSCFSKDGYEESDYYDEIEADLKRELERKEQEKKKNQKNDFLSGGTQSAVAIPALKIMPIPEVPPLARGGSNPVSAAVDTGIREGRPNKKSKWDKSS